MSTHVCLRSTASISPRYSGEHPLTDLVSDMTSVLSYRPSTSGTTGSTNSAIPHRQGSLSSFPSTRTPSNHSIRNGAPPTVNIPRIPRPNSEAGSSRTPSTPSARSSAQHTPQRKASVRPTRKLKSQYPADSTERHVEYILVASFHVDQGPIMEHQYPGAISGDENMLAELMLPDQVHNRKEDWTIFFLHKDLSEEEDPVDGEESEKKENAEDDVEDESHDKSAATEDGLNASGTETGREHDEVEGAEGPPLIYVLNLVNTKHDPSAKRFVCASSLSAMSPSDP